MHNLRNKWNELMRHRYGMDDLNKFLLWSAVIFNILSWFRIFQILYICALILFGIAIYRMLSRNYVKRSMENQTYHRYQIYIQRRVRVFQNNRKDRNYHYYLCPHCNQIVRVPRGKGKITITCPNCHHTFDKRS